MRRPTLDDLANLGIIITCLVVISVGVERLGGGSSRDTAEGSLFRVGDAAPAIDGVNYAASDAVLLMFISSTCRFCTDSMPFYRELAGRREPGVQIIAASTEPTDVSLRYLRAFDVEVGRVVTIGTAVPTPTLVLVDRFGKITDTWIGLQDTGGQAAIRAALGRPGH